MPDFVILNGVEYITAQHSGHPYFDHDQDKVVRHDMDAIVALPGVTIKGVFQFQGDGRGETVRDYLEKIKGLFRES